MGGGGVVAARMRVTRADVPEPRPAPGRRREFSLEPSEPRTSWAFPGG